jgi:hypothetical protein
MDERWQEIERIYHAARELDGTTRANLGRAFTTCRISAGQGPLAN